MTSRYLSAWSIAGLSAIRKLPTNALVGIARPAGWASLTRGIAQGFLTVPKITGGAPLLASFREEALPNCRRPVVPLIIPQNLVHHIFPVRLSQTPNPESRHNSPTVQHRKRCPSPEMDPSSTVKDIFGGSLTKGRQVHKYSSRSGHRTPRKVHAKRQRPKLSPYLCS